MYLAAEGLDLQYLYLEWVEEKVVGVNQVVMPLQEPLELCDDQCNMQLKCQV